MSEAEFEAVQQRLRLVDQQLYALEQQLVEQQRALSTLESLEADQDALVPIGGGLHVRARLAGDQPVVVPVGAGYAADQDLEAAKKSLQARLAAGSDAMKRTEAEAEQLAQKAQALAAKLQADS